MGSAAVNRLAVNIRKFVLRAARLDDLVELGSLTPQAAAFLQASVRAGLNILFSGGTQPVRFQGLRHWESQGCA